MANAWIEHIRRWSKANGVSYGCAISKPECRASYQAKKPGAERAAMAEEDVNRALPKKRVVRGRTIKRTEIMGAAAPVPAPSPLTAAHMRREAINPVTGQRRIVLKRSGYV